MDKYVDYVDYNVLEKVYRLIRAWQAGRLWTEPRFKGQRA